MSKKYIADDTREGYQKSVMRLVIWLHDNEQRCLHDTSISELNDVIVNLHNANELGEEEEEQEQSEEQRKQAEKVRVKALAPKAFDLSCPSSPKFCPIKLDLLDVKTSTKFLFSHAGAKDNNHGDIFLSKSGHGTYRSALKDLYRTCKLEMPLDYERDLKEEFKCPNKSHQEEKQKKAGRMATGKDPLPFSLYRQLCVWMLEDDGAEVIFGHAFITLMWNLVCRSKNTIYINCNHISWHEDALTILFAHTKTDMEGFESAQKQHLYANPHDLPICMKTALAKYMLFAPRVDDNMLFSKNSYQRFSKYLKKLVTAHAVKVKQMGIYWTIIPILYYRYSLIPDSTFLHRHLHSHF